MILRYRLNIGEEGEATAAKIAIGAQQRNDAATTIATVLADLFQSGNFWHSGGNCEAIFSASRLATTYITKWKDTMRINITVIYKKLYRDGSVSKLSKVRTMATNHESDNTADMRILVVQARYQYGKQIEIKRPNVTDNSPFSDPMNRPNLIRRRTVSLKAPEP